MPRQPLRVAMAGAGMISWYHLVAWGKISEQAEVVAICDPDISKAKARATEFGVPSVYSSGDALLSNERLDALDIVSPRQTHAEWIRAASSRQIRVMCQKPLTPTLAEAEELRGELSGQNALMVHENWRFRPWYRQAKRWIDAGELGETIGANMLTVDSGLLPGTDGVRPHLVRQPFLKTEKRLMVSEALIHHLDVLRFLCGEMRVLSARTVYADPEISGDTLATVMLEAKSGAPVVVSGTMTAAGFPPNAADRLEIYGTQASLTLDNARLALVGPNPQSIVYDTIAGYQTSFDSAVAHFVQCLLSNKNFETSIDDNIETLRLVETAYLVAVKPDLTR
jgi:predicted dehydrogenase